MLVCASHTLPVEVNILGGVDNHRGAKKYKNDDKEGGDGRHHPGKKARSKKSSMKGSGTGGGDPALVLLREALEAVSTPRMYLEGMHFLHVCIRHLNNSGDTDADPKGGGEDDDNNGVSYLVYDSKDAEGVAQRLAVILNKLYKGANSKGVSSNAILLDQVNHLLPVTYGPRKAKVLLSKAVTTSAAEDANGTCPCHQRAGIFQRILEALPSFSTGDASTLSPIFILWRSLKRTPL